jgi:trans-L-3-hydroxyproline dehydratase
MSEKRLWAERRADAVRKNLMFEPRGHADMFGAALTEPVQTASDAGLLFMSPAGFHPMSGHGVIAVATIALERRLLTAPDNRRIVFDTPAGPVRAMVEYHDQDDGGVSRVTATNPPSFVLHPGVDVLLPGRRLRADVAFGGEFYAIVDAESAGVPLDSGRLGDLRNAGKAIAAAVDAAVVARHPLEASLSGVAGTIFTAPPQGRGADLRTSLVFANGSVDRSPGGTAMSAVMAVLDAMGLLPENGQFVSEGLSGEVLEGRLAGRTQLGPTDAVIVSIAGTAHITGDHVFYAADDDPFRNGFSFSS